LLSSPLSSRTSRTRSAGIETFRGLEYSKSSIEEVPFEKDEIAMVIQEFKKHAIDNHRKIVWYSNHPEKISTRYPTYNEILKYAAETLGMKIDQALGESTGAWQFGGFNAAEATRQLGNWPETFPLTYTQAKIALFFTVDWVLNDMKTKNREFYSLRTVRRKQPGKTTRRMTLLKPVVRRMSNVPGLGELLSYKLPKDLRRVLKAMGIKYKPTSNPRIRRLKKGQARRRFVFAYYSVSPNEIMQNTIKHQNLVRASRNWQAIFNEEISIHPITSTSNIKKFLDWVVTNEDVTRKGFCSLLGFANHAFVLYGYLADKKLKMFIIDPHASPDIARLSHARSEFKEIKDRLVAYGKQKKLTVSIRTSNDQCGTSDGLVPVQPPAEGSCAIAAIALILNVARLLNTTGLRLIRQKSHRKFCQRAYNEVRIQDAVFASQVVRD